MSEGASILQPEQQSGAQPDHFGSPKVPESRAPPRPRSRSFRIRKDESLGCSESINRSSQSDLSHEVHFVCITRHIYNMDSMEMSSFRDDSVARIKRLDQMNVIHAGRKTVCERHRPYAVVSVFTCPAMTHTSYSGASI